MRTIQQVTILTYNEFDDLVHKHFPLHCTFSCVETNEWTNYSDYLFEDVGIYKYPWQKESVEDVNEWMNNKVTDCPPSSWDILSYLCDNGVLTPGNYLIEVSW